MIDVSLLVVIPITEREIGQEEEVFLVEQIVAALMQAELGYPIADLVRQTVISAQTFYRGKNQYAGLELTQVRELKQFSEENARL